MGEEVSNKNVRENQDITAESNQSLSRQGQEPKAELLGRSTRYKPGTWQREQTLLEREKGHRMVSVSLLLFSTQTRRNFSFAALINAVVSSGAVGCFTNHLQSNGNTNRNP